MVCPYHRLNAPLSQRALAGSRIIVGARLVVLAVSNLVLAEQRRPFAALQVGPSFERDVPKSQVVGGFRVQGSDTMHALMRRLVLDFRARQPKVSIDLKAGGSAKAIGEFLEAPQPGRIVVK